MLIVMLLILAGTGSALVAVHSVQVELRVAGEQRRRTQARYVTEAAALAPVEYIGMLPAQDFIYQWSTWQLQPAPLVDRYGDFPIYATPADPTADPVRYNAFRLDWQQIQILQLAGEWPASSPPTGTDLFGSLGPATQWQPDPYVLDFMDCQPETAAATPGASMGKGKKESKVFDCVLKARGSTSAFGPDHASQANRLFILPNGAGSYNRRIFAMPQTTRVRLRTPPMQL